MKNLSAVLLALSTFSANAVWLNTTGEVKHIATYGTKNTILVTLGDSNGETLAGRAVSACSNTTSFAISHNISEEARNRMFSMLLAAKASGQKVTLAYNDVGNCEPWDSNSSVYRKIVRIQ